MKMPSSSPPRSPRSALWLLTALMSWLTVMPLEAYELIGVEWPSGRAPFWINPNFPDTELSGTREQQIDILLGAAATWREQTAADFDFEFEGTNARAGFNVDDGQNTISFSGIDGGDALAATLIDGIGNRITAFDIVFFGRTQGFENRWNGPQDPGIGTIDISGVAVHELGHALGLDHTEIREATMFASAINRGLPLRTLHPDDRAGTEFIYGLRGPVVIEPIITNILPPNATTSGGEEVLIDGANFTWTSDTILRFGETTLTRNQYEVESAHTIRIPSMVGGPEGPVDVEIENELGNVTVANAFRFGPPPPQLIAVEPTLGPADGGIDVIVQGRSLTSEAVIRFGGALLEDVVFIDSETISGRLPPAAEVGAVDVELVQGIDTSVLLDGFRYTRKILAVGEGQGQAGDQGVEVDFLASSDAPLTGFSFALSFDASLLAVEGFSVEGTAADGADFAAPSIDNETGIVTFGVVMDFGDEPDKVIPAGEEQLVATMATSIDESAEVGTRIPLHVEEMGGSPPIELLFTPVGQPNGVRPYAADGSVRVLAGGIFLRGDADSNFDLELTDAVYHLNALFQGGPLSDCRDAADSNDDARLDISDAVYTLLFLFVGGPPPPPPYPEAGVDPTDDGLDCP